jgi:hypothetical protein
MLEFYHTICLINDSPAHTLIGSSTKLFHQPASPQIALQVPRLHFLKQSLTISTDSDPENCVYSNRDQKKFNTSLRRSRLSEISFPRAANKTFLIQSWTNLLGKKKDLIQKPQQKQVPKIRDRTPFANAMHLRMGRPNCEIQKPPE